MSTDHVPENDRDLQLQELRNILMGNNAFGRLRGTVNGSLTDLVEDCVEEGSPSAALRTWDRWVGDLRVMLNLIAKFRRDNWRFAEMELKRALADEAYILPGETVPLEETTPYTVFMVDPELTFAMHQFFQDWWALMPEGSEQWVSPPEFWGRYGDEAFVRERYGPAMAALLKRISWERVYAPVTWGSQTDLVFDWVMSAFAWRIEHIETRRVGKRTMEFTPWGHYRRSARRVHAQLTGNSRRFSSMSCLYGKAAEQSALLGGFKREDQPRVASWQLHLPTAMIGESKVYAVCLRPEAEHARWRKERPQFTSRGVAHGHCVVLVPIDSVERVFAGEDLHRLRLYQNSQLFA